MKSAITILPLPSTKPLIRVMIVLLMKHYDDTTTLIPPYHHSSVSSHGDGDGDEAAMDEVLSASKWTELWRYKRMKSDR